MYDENHYYYFIHFLHRKRPLLPHAIINISEGIYDPPQALYMIYQKDMKMQMKKYELETNKKRFYFPNFKTKMKF